MMPDIKMKADNHEHSSDSASDISYLSGVSSLISSSRDRKSDEFNDNDKDFSFSVDDIDSLQDAQIDNKLLE